jgi:hypothetical protein
VARAVARQHHAVDAADGAASEGAGRLAKWRFHLLLDAVQEDVGVIHARSTNAANLQHRVGSL